MAAEEEYVQSSQRSQWIVRSSSLLFDRSRVATMVIITGDYSANESTCASGVRAYRRATGERECGERERLAAPRRRSLATGEPLR